MLGRQRTTLDAVEMQHGGMRREAGEQRRGGGLGGPVHHGGEIRVIGLGIEAGGLRFGAGDHEGVEARRRQGGVRCVEPIEMRAGERSARHRGEAEEAQLDLGTDQAPELTLGLDQGGVRHVVEEADPQARRRGRRLVQGRRNGVDETGFAVGRTGATVFQHGSLLSKRDGMDRAPG